MKALVIIVGILMVLLGGVIGSYTPAGGGFYLLGIVCGAFFLWVAAAEAFNR